jgi:hypothetical protein
MLAAEDGRVLPVTVRGIVGGEMSSNIRAFSENGGSGTFNKAGNDTTPDAVFCGVADGLVGRRNALLIVVGTINVGAGEFTGVAA